MRVFVFNPFQFVPLSTSNRFDRIRLSVCILCAVHTNEWILKGLILFSVFITRFKCLGLVFDALNEVINMCLLIIIYSIAILFVSPFLSEWQLACDSPVYGLYIWCFYADMPFYYLIHWEWWKGSPYTHGVVIDRIHFGYTHNLLRCMISQIPNHWHTIQFVRSVCTWCHHC